MDNEEKVVDSVRFSEEQLALIDQADAELDRGEEMTMEEAHELAKERTKAWMKATVERKSA